MEEIKHLKNQSHHKWTEWPSVDAYFYWWQKVPYSQGVSNLVLDITNLTLDVINPGFN